MKINKRERIFLIISALILVAAVIFVFAGTRVSGPEITYHEFLIPVTYEEYGELKTQNVIYCGQYWEEDQSFHVYYESSGMHDMVYMREENGNPIWWFQLQLEPGYLMGDPAYADFYAEGMPEPSIGYYDEEWNEHNGVTEAEPRGIRLIGCEYPEPIENKIVDKGVKLDHMAIAVLMAFAFVIFLFGIILVKKEADVIYVTRDKVAQMLNIAICVLALPLLFSFGDEWDLLMGEPVDSVLAALMAPVTVLGICASVLLRRKGKSLPGLVVQFVGLLLFLYLITKNLLIAFGAYLLFLVAGIAVGIWLAVRGRKGEAAASTTLDKISCVTNIGLIPVYAIFSLLMMFMAAITGTNYGASSAQEFWAFIFSLVIAATPVYCGIALGMSVSLRKKGRSIAGFFVQFAGFGGIILFLLIDMIPWISITLN